MTHSVGLADTSVFIASELGRPFNRALLTDELRISVITIAELEVGIHAAADTDSRALRMATLDSVSSLDPYPVDPAAAHEWARMRHRLGLTGRRINVNDLWIAAIAVARGLPIVTQDDDFEALADLGGPAIIRV